MRKIDIDAIPDLTTPVGVQGSTRQKEVGGPACVAIVAGIIYMGSEEGGESGNG